MHLQFFQSTLASDTLASVHCFFLCFLQFSFSFFFFFYFPLPFRERERGGITWHLTLSRAFPLAGVEQGFIVLLLFLIVALKSLMLVAKCTFACEFVCTFV